MLTRVTRVECDQCGRAASMSMSRRKAARWLRANGWDVHTGDMADLCPLCDGEPNRRPTADDLLGAWRS